jgi:hypothetical protein
VQLVLVLYGVNEIAAMQHFLQFLVFYLLYTASTNTFTSAQFLQKITKVISFGDPQVFLKCSNFIIGKIIRNLLYHIRCTSKFTALELDRFHYFSMIIIDRHKNIYVT